MNGAPLGWHPAQCPACAGDPTSPCDRCDGSRVIAVEDEPRSMTISEKVAELRRRTEGTRE